MKSKARTKQWRLGTFAIVPAFAVGIVASGCSYIQRGRPVRDSEKLELQSAVLLAPSGPGWTALRSFDVPVRSFDLVHVGSDGGSDQWVRISERDGGMPLPSRETLLAYLSSHAKKQLGDPDLSVEEIVATPPPKFGGSAVVVALRAEESDAKAGLLKKRAFYSAQIAFVPPAAPDRTCVIQYVELGTTDLQQTSFEESWRALLERTELRSDDEAHVKAAARADDFPKRFQPGFARRSLTLPAMGFQWALDHERRLAPGDPTGSWSSALALGITDHLEVVVPGFLWFAFGEVEALTRPELAVGAGLTRLEQHDAERGSVWGFGVSARARKRLAPDVALRGVLFAEGAHESRTGRTRAGGAADAGVVWDIHPFVTLGIETGWSASPWEGEISSMTWVGGRVTPLVTLHFPFIDIGLNGAATWDHGRPGAVAGAGFLLTL